MPADHRALVPPPAPRKLSKIYEICEVCLGNICRSPMAEALLRPELASAGLAGRAGGYGGARGGARGAGGGGVGAAAAAPVCGRGWGPGGPPPRPPPGGRGGGGGGARGGPPPGGGGPGAPATTEPYSPTAANSS